MGDTKIIFGYNLVAFSYDFEQSTNELYISTLVISSGKISQQL